MLMSRVLEIRPNAMPREPSTSCAAKPIPMNGSTLSRSIEAKRLTDVDQARIVDFGSFPAELPYSHAINGPKAHGRSITRMPRMLQDQASVAIVARHFHAFSLT